MNATKTLVLVLCLSLPSYSTADESRAQTAAETRAKKLPWGYEKGARLYREYCVLCHGSTGRGDGRLSAVIKDPAPADLTASTRRRGYLTRIIGKGGRAMGRSDRMPAWEHEFSRNEMKALVNFVYSLRSIPMQPANNTEEE
ncbi:MAG: cytochrome c [Pseudomonadota bacterium]